MPDVAGLRHTRDALLKLRDPDRRPSPSAIIEIDRILTDSGSTIPTRLTTRQTEPHHRQHAANHANLRSLTPTPINGPQQLPTVLLTNCRSLNLRKQEELAVMVDQQRPEIVLLTETWLTDMKEHTAKLPNFLLITSNRRNRIGGGVAAYISNNLQVKVLEKFTSPTLSTLWLKLNTPNSTPIVYGLIYHPPSRQSEEQDKSRQHILDSLAKHAIKHHGSICLAGDFNKLNISAVCQVFNLRPIVDFSTRGDASLDQIYTNIGQYNACEKLAPLNGSDHCCILLKGSQKLKPQVEYITKRKITPPTRQHILRDLATESWSTVLQERNIDRKVQNLHDIITVVMDRHAPLERVKRKRNHKPWFDSLARKLRNAKTTAYKKGCPTWKTFAALLKRHLAKARRSWIDDKMQSSDFWKITRELTGSNKKQLRAHYQLDGEWVNQEQLSECLNSFFTSVGGTPSNHALDITPTTSSNSLIMHIGEVKQLLRQINTSKAVINTDFPPWISKAAAEDLCVPVTNIINTMLATGRFPSLWKCAQVTPIEKVNNPTKCSEFRPISLLHHLSKVAEKAILKFYSIAVIPTLNSNQFAYQKGKSTTDALLSAVNEWTESLDQPQTSHVQIACLDMSKAFDRMDKHHLCSTLMSRGTNQHIVRLVMDYLTGRSQRVQVGPHTSAARPIVMGTPQGTVLGPMLWLTYIDSLSPSCSNTMKYADDVTLTNVVQRESTSTSTSAALAQAVDDTQTWCEEHNMLLNETKSVTMTIKNPRSRSKPAPCQPVTINGRQLEEVTTAKLLGVTLDTGLSFQPHVETITNKARKLIFSLLKMKRCGMEVDDLVRFYQGAIRPVLSYAAPVWHSMANVADITRTEAFAMKLIFPDGDNYQERLKNANLPEINEYLAIESQQYFKRLEEPKHHLHHLLPPTQTSKGLRHSSRLANRYVCPTRTTLRSKSFVPYHCNK